MAAGSSFSPDAEGAWVTASTQGFVTVGRWPIRVLLGHLADAELVFVHRMRRAVGEAARFVGFSD